MYYTQIRKKRGEHSYAEAELIRHAPVCAHHTIIAYEMAFESLRIKWSLTLKLLNLCVGAENDLARILELKRIADEDGICY